MTQLESFKPGQKKPATPQSKEAGSSDSVRYELFYRPEQAQFSKNAKVCYYKRLLPSQLPSLRRQVPQIL